MDGLGKKNEEQKAFHFDSDELISKGFCQFSKACFIFELDL